MELVRQTIRKQTRKRGKITEEEQAGIVQLFMEGYDPDEIAEGYGRTEDAIERVLAERGYGSRFNVTRAEVEEWARLYALGYSASRIAEQGRKRRSPGTIAYHLARRGVRMRHPALTRRLARKLKESKKRRH